MRRAVASLALIACVAWSGDVQAQGTKKKPAPAPKLSAEMKDFMSYFNGDGKKTDEALAKYRAADADVADMAGEMSVANAKVTKAVSKDDEDQYTMSARMGAARRTCLIVWKDKKIQRIKQLSLELD